jgi:hypothetical protein
MQTFKNTDKAALYFIKKQYPNVYDEADRVVNQRRLKAWSLIKPIYKAMYDSSEAPENDKHFFVAVIIELFAPEWITAGTKLPPGLRDLISAAMGYINSEMVNYHSSALDVYMKNPRFYQRVKQTAQAFMEEYK